MTYKNTKTGFVFDSPCEIKAEGWEKITPKPFLNEKKENKDEKPVKKTSKSK